MAEKQSDNGVLTRWRRKRGEARGISRTSAAAAPSIIVAATPVAAVAAAATTCRSGGRMFAVVGGMTPNEAVQTPTRAGASRENAPPWE